MLKRGRGDRRRETGAILFWKKKRKKEKEEIQMGESMVASFFMESLNVLFSRETDLLFGLEDAVQSLRTEMISLLKIIENEISCFETEFSEEIERIVEQIRDVAYEAEDVIDEFYVYNMSLQQEAKLKVFQFISVATKIRIIGTKIRKCYNLAKYHVVFNSLSPSASVSGVESLQMQSPTELFMADAAISNMEEAKLMIEQLTGPEPGFRVVSIVGMGGLGKTTLAQKVYNDPLVQNNFGFCAWVSLSQNLYQARQVIQAILNSGNLATGDDTMNDDDLTMTLRKLLRCKRYLLVLDDVWKTEIWDDLKGMFPNNLQGSRIILTTRNKKVALYVNPTAGRHYLRPKTPSETWKFISKRVFYEEKCPQELGDLGLQIVKKCRGLPLEVVLLPGILKTKEEDDKRSSWKKVLSRVSSFEAQDRQYCLDLLALSYDYLPYPLKSCFMYLAVFPQGLDIPAKRLIRLWVAEGFVPSKSGESMEDTAHDFLRVLINRSLVLPVKLKFDGRVKACRLDDLVHDFCVLVANKEKFLNVFRDTESPSPPSSCRRLAIHSKTLHYLPTYHSISRLRSFFYPNFNQGQLSAKALKSFSKSSSLLRVLDLWDVSIECIPSEVERLIHLRYLRLKSYTAESLPSSIGNLLNLQSLEVKAPKVKHPHIHIWRMQQLRHLYFHGQVLLLDPPPEATALCNLQTLSSIRPDRCTQFFLTRCPNLLTLRIYGDLDTHIQLVFKNLPLRNKLHTLILERDRRFCPLSSLPDWSEIPSNIIKLTLSEIQLAVDPMPRLGILPNLQSLKLANGAYTGDVLSCSDGHFPQLRVLKLINLGILKWDLSQGSMPSLRNVVINRCASLEGLPSALKCMLTLRELDVYLENASVVNDARETQKHFGDNLLKLTIYHSAIC